MATNGFPDGYQDPRVVTEENVLRKLMLQLPEIRSYRSLIKFSHTGNKFSLDLALLPPGLASKIEGLFI